MPEQIYAVEYRNMHTALHGLFTYYDRDAAEAVDEYLRCNADEYCEALDDPFVQECAMRSDCMTDDDYSEINFRDVEWNDSLNQYVYRNPWDTELDPIIIVNDGHVVHDLWL